MNSGFVSGADLDSAICIAEKLVDFWDKRDGKKSLMPKNQRFDGLLTFDAIAAEIGCTRQRAQQIVRDTIADLRKGYQFNDPRVKALKTFYEDN